eukprot:TRINITY_DN99991_c0_g1_i1.p1 TRINITY_DN99991_c0_g1~~TRINITY_DN99991_c0_g1_i1.p1  ORF type:complete len:186 (-),score=26.99 TRINITY_DN99991_c0_g1_i1:46-579(-)
MATPQTPTVEDITLQLDDCNVSVPRAAIRFSKVLASVADSSLNSVIPVRIDSKTWDCGIGPYLRHFAESAQAPTKLPRPLPRPLQEMLSSWELDYLQTSLAAGTNANSVIVNTLHAALQLEIDSLKDLICAYYASLMTLPTEEMLHQGFGIGSKDSFSREERLELERAYPWVTRKPD